MGKVQKPTGDERDKTLADKIQERIQGLFAPKKDAPASISIQPAEKLKARNAYRVFLIFIPVQLLVITFLALQIAPKNPWQFWVLFGLGINQLVFELVGLANVRRGRHELGIWLAFSVFLTMLVIIPLIYSGMGVLAAGAAVIITIFIGSLTLPPRQMNLFIAIGVIVGVADLLIEFYIPFQPFQRQSLPAFTNLIYFVMAILTLALGYIIVPQFRNYSLRTKLVFGFLAVTLIPLTIFTFLNDRNLRNTLTDDANKKLVSAASQTTTQLDSFINNNLETIRAAASIPYFSDFISSTDRLDQKTKITSTLTALARQNAVYIYSVAILDIRGENLADTSTAGVGLNESDHDYFIKAIETGRPFASDVEFSQTTAGAASIYFSAPVHDPAGKIIGVIRTRYNALVLQNIVTANNNLTGQGSFAQLVNRQSHLRLAHGKTSSYNYKSAVPLNAATVSDLQAQRLLPPGTPAELSTNLPAFEAALKNYKTQPVFVAELESDEDTLEQGAIVKMKTQEWFVVYAQSQEVFLAPINTQARNNFVFAVAIGLVAALLGLLMAQTLAGPITRLTQTAEKISGGDINAQAKVESRDEIGTLAGAFNNMTAQLREFIATLEQRVGERTLQLETANRQNTRRAAQFESIAQTARSMTTLQNLSSLLPHITELVSQQFGFYHVGIFLLDDKQEYAVLAAANSTGGQQMIQKGHKLKIGQVGIVGYTAARGNARIALDTGLDATYFDNPDLPDTRSELALPLKLGTHVIGVLDVQSLDSSAFTNDDIASLTILADQVSIAIENTRQYEATLKSLEQTEATYRQYVQHEWTRLAQEENLTGYRYISGSSSRLETPVDFGDIKAIVNAGRIYQGDEEKTGAADLAVPVKLRGEVIGILSISTAGKNRWSDDEIDIVEAVAERLALSIENARLFQVTTNRAERERVVSEIASKISGNLRMDSLLRTTAQELSLAMNGSEVLIQLQAAKQDRGPQ